MRLRRFSAPGMGIGTTLVLAREILRFRVVIRHGRMAVEQVRMGCCGNRLQREMFRHEVHMRTGGMGMALVARRPPPLLRTNMARAGPRRATSTFDLGPPLDCIGRLRLRPGASWHGAGDPYP